MTSATRIEHDSMGDLEVPAHALYGAQTQRAIKAQYRCHQFQ